MIFFPLSPIIPKSAMYASATSGAGLVSMMTGPTLLTRRALILVEAILSIPPWLEEATWGSLAYSILRERKNKHEHQDRGKNRNLGVTKRNLATLTGTSRRLYYGFS